MNIKDLHIGDTPLVSLTNIVNKYHLENNLYGKVESFNMTGSIKDRAAYFMIKDLLDQDKIHAGDTIIEATSGNTGIALSAIGLKLGLHVIIIMPASMSVQRQEMMRYYQADLRLIKGGMKECHDEAIRLNQEIPHSYIIGQFENKANVKAHILTTGPELEKQLDHIDYIFAGIGTGGTVTGLAKYFKGKVKVIGIEPKQSPLINKGEAHPHKIQGIGANFIPDILELDIIDDVIMVDDDEALKMAHILNDNEDVFVGYSSGAALLGAINYIHDHHLKNKNIVIILPDKGDRYSW